MNSGPIRNLEVIDDLRRGQPWWEALDPRFYARRDRFDLSPKDRLAVEFTSGIDRGVRRLGALGVSLTAIPVGFNPHRLRRAFRQSELYRQAATNHDASQLFRDPPSTRVERRPTKRGFQPEDGIVEDIRFESPFVPIHPELRASWQRQSANRVAHARYWRHGGDPRPTIVLIHGYYADAYWFNERYFDLRRIYEMGCDVALFTLPFHGPRRGRGSFFSGHQFFAGGLSRINEAFAQAVMDFRVLLTHLLERGAPRVGVTGISLGGYTTALLAAVEPRLAFAIPNVPVVSLPDLTLEWTPIGTAVRTGMRLCRTSLSDVRWITAGHCPLSYDPVLPPERLMIIGGVGDRLAPPKHARLLWEHWGRPRIHWFPGSHLFHVRRDRYLDEIESFFASIGFLHADEPRASHA